MSVSTEQIKALREETGAGVLDCRKALESAGGDFDQAVLVLREKGLAKAAKRSERETFNGMLDLYSHGDGRVGVMVEVNCETDFVARMDEFRHFAHEIALQIAANAPEYVSQEDVPAAVIEEKRQIARKLAQDEGKPENVLDRIVEGRMAKFFEDSCLLQQPYIRDDSKSVEDLVNELVTTTGENIRIRRFERWEVGESTE
jgi:elongation factor Ts